MKRNLRTLAAFLAVLTAAGTVSCGGSGSASDTTVTGGDTTTAPVTEAGYDYPDVDFGGYKFKVINFSDYYNCYVRLDLDEMTGETVE